MVTQALEFSGVVTGGRLPREVSDRIAAAVRRMDGKRLVISIKEQKRRRSNNQNAYYWGVVVAIITEAFRDAGNMVDAEDVHDFLKEHVGKLAQVLVTPQGEVLRGPGSTRKLNTQEMEVYLEKVRVWAVETLDLLIPLPNESSHDYNPKQEPHVPLDVCIDILSCWGTILAWKKCLEISLLGCSPISGGRS